MAVHFSLKNVGLAFDGHQVLNSIDVEFNQHRIGIIGANGSGKSSFVRLLNGLVKPTYGQLLLDGEDVSRDIKQLRRQVGFVFQNPDHQLVFPTVEEDLGFGLKNLKWDKKKIGHKVDELLDSFNLNHLKTRLCHTLSGGEKQMIALLGVVIAAPRVIILDEPTTLLDLRHKHKMLSMIEQLEQQVIFVTHDLDLITQFERVLCFENGQIVNDGRPQDVIANYTERMSRD